ncbi:hypothetical protein BKK54_10255, partial [Rodentibacter genomosp. 1]
MNKIFKVIFNHTTQTWAAVSELAKGHCKSSSNNTVEVSESREGKFPSVGGIKIIAMISAMMMAPNAIAVKAKPNEIKWVNSEGTSIAAGDANGDANAIAIGRDNVGHQKHESARAWAPGAIAIGTESQVGKRVTDEESRGGIAIGFNATTYGKRGVSIGTSSFANGENATAIGGNANATGEGASALGANTIANGERATVVGENANATGKGASAMGANTTANGENATAVGGYASATGDGTLALGGNSTASGAGATAVGFNSTANKLNSVALGNSAQSIADKTIVIGAEAKVLAETHRETVVIGYNATGNSQESVVIGANAQTRNLHSTAIGINTLTSSQYATAIGAAAKVIADSKYGTALGAGSEAGSKNTVDDLKFNNSTGVATTATIAAKTANSVLSIGNSSHKRQIVNVAAGRVSQDSTDAVNGSQLYAVMKNSGFNIQQNGSTKSRINNDGLVNFTDGSYTTAVVTDDNNSPSVKMNVVTQDISTNAIGVTSVSGTSGLTTAKTVSDAINNALNNSSFFIKANDDAGEKITRNGSINIAQGKNINVERSGSKITIKTVDNPKFTNVEAGGSLTVSGKSNLRGDILLGGEGKRVTFQGNSTVDMGGNKIINVKAGTSAKDAVNKEQLDVVNTIATSANNMATLANNTANVASTTATNANNTANTANATATNANNTANAANTTATNANNIANTANATATNANNTANAANTTATNANKIANTANAIATNAKSTANTALEKVNKGWNIATRGNDGTNSSANVQMEESVTIVAGKNLNVTQSDKEITLAVSDSPNFTSITTTNGATVGGDLVVNGRTTVKDLTASGDTQLGNVSLGANSNFNAGGNRLTNVSAATQDNDATTLSQVKGLISNATTNATNINTTNLNSTDGTFNSTLTSKGETTLSGNTTVGGKDKTFNIANGTTVNMGGNVLTNIAEGTNATDAATKGQLDKMAQNITNNLTALSNNPLTFTGNSGSTARKLGETLTISGDKATAGTYSSKNVNTVVTDGKVEIQIAENPEFETMSTTGNANIGGNLNVNGATTTKDLKVTNNANVEKDLTVGGNSTVTGNSTVKGDSTVNGDSVVKGNSTVEGTTTTTDLNVTNNATVTKDLTVGGNSTVTGNST